METQVYPTQSSTFIHPLPLSTNASLVSEGEIQADSMASLGRR